LAFEVGGGLRPSSYDYRDSISIRRKGISKRKKGHLKIIIFEDLVKENGKWNILKNYID